MMYDCGIAAKVPCNAVNKCKFGGTCIKGYCACAMNCHSSLWGREIYCGLKKSRRKVYKNLCELQSHACQLQKNIPLIPLKNKSDYRQKCKTAAKANELKEQLCQSYVGFLKNCGSASPYLSKNINAGICLNRVKDNEKYCRCPANRQGHLCETIISIEESTQEKNVWKSEVVIIIVVVACLSFLLFCFLCGKHLNKRFSNINETVSEKIKLRFENSKGKTPLYGEEAAKTVDEFSL